MENAQYSTINLGLAYPSKKNNTQVRLPEPIKIRDREFSPPGSMFLLFPNKFKLRVLFFPF
jgi:hypothetical protein